MFRREGKRTQLPSKRQQTIITQRHTTDRKPLQFLTGHCNTSTNTSMCPELQDNSLRFPELQDSSSRCLGLQDNTSRCPELQDSSSRCPELQDSSSRCLGLQDNTSRCPEPQDNTSRFPDLNHLYQSIKLSCQLGETSWLLYRSLISTSNCACICTGSGGVSVRSWWSLL